MARLCRPTVSVYECIVPLQPDLRNEQTRVAK